MKPIELDLNDVNDPDYTRLGLWINNKDSQTVEFYMSGLIYMSTASLQCTITKEQALLLANKIIETFEENNNK